MYVRTPTGPSPRIVCACILRPVPLTCSSPTYTAVSTMSAQQRHRAIVALSHLIQRVSTTKSQRMCVPLTLFALDYMREQTAFRCASLSAALAPRTYIQRKNSHHPCVSPSPLPSHKGVPGVRETKTAFVCVSLWSTYAHDIENKV